MTTTVRQPPKTLPGVITRSAWLPPRMCVYGVPGIGKSTLGAGAPNPLFVPTEAGVENLDVARFPVARSLEEFLGNLRLAASGEHDHRAVVIDTLNGLLPLYFHAKKDIPGEKGKPLYDFVGYGGHSGWKAVARDLASDVFPLLDQCQRRGMFVIILAHTGDYTRKNPFGDDIVVSAPSIPKQVWGEIHPWLDVIGRADYVYSTVKAGTKAKASTDVEVVDGVKVKVRRLIFAGGVEQDCKTRVGYELPPEMPLSWDVFASHLGNVKALANEIRDLWHHFPADKADATLRWLGVGSLDQVADANRTKLSQLRDRLLELKAARAAEPPAEAASPESAASAGAGNQ